MPLQVNIQHLLRDSLHLAGELPVEELDLGLTDEMVQARSPLVYDLEAEKLEHAILVQGHLSLRLDCQCVRCLKKFVFHLELPHWVAHLALEGEDAVPVANDLVDLSPPIREDILLGFPQHPACEPECSGLTGVPRGKSKKSNRAKAGLPSSALAELNKLKL